MTNTLVNNVKVSKVEVLKQKSNFLRGPIDTELKDGNPFFSQDGIQILKFHGSYQQKDRDLEKAKIKGEEAQYSMMLRTRSPGGVIPWQLYLALDRLCDKYGNHTLRVTTRQGFQIHGILKENLKTVIADITKNMGSTVGACGDINRNVMAPPAPFKNKPEYQYAREYAVKIADLLAPQAGAYYDIWLDGEMAVTASEATEVTEARSRQGTGAAKTNISDIEPIYGVQYLPRKFKIAIAVAGDNSVDLYTNDLSLVVVTNAANELEGFNVYVGGGLGRAHNNDATIVRLADRLGFVPVDQIYDVIKAIVALQRDYGDRHNRRHSRFKHILEEWGVEKFKQVLLDYYPTKLADARELPAFKYQDYLGWHEQGDGKYFVGVSIENGRVSDREDLQLKTALREISEKFHHDFVLTPNHNLLITEVAADEKEEIQKILDRCHVLAPDQIDSLVRYSMACPAFPTCGLAIAESERALPSVLARIRQLLVRLGLEKETFVTRMTGCPNGCARPYMAELAFVGSAADEYQIWLGGNFDATRLAQPYVQRLHINNLEKGLEPLFVYFRDERIEGEGFGDFCDRKGIEDLKKFADAYIPEVDDSNFSKGKRKDVRHRVTLSPKSYELLKQAVEENGASMKDIVEAALEKYLA
ncbi:sulfite reductase, ferredoxin dependent [Pseudanabaena sp. FACHB-1998]|uniref:sulfite reductase, ferredoxin dependent n=1 Tax=Pseudanabaena sp. FACHB-1998 TaxID=2692858 RepID=UPI00167FE5F5|nr:sulfite reductase, ferredoxin dependent [Pseudanabaena sp. FACHB-1998]MBD2178167.1 sulfite reductase, ferredoxin dependent [Pseudanabaena sp. FACHB-1998]